jgi:hypothetical protein
MTEKKAFITCTVQLSPKERERIKENKIRSKHSNNKNEIRRKVLL